MTRLQGKTALITGATSGIGLATAKLFVQHGARVVIVGQDPTRAAMAQVRGRIEAHFGRLDIVFANAGIARPMPFADVDEDNIDAQMDVNFKGVVHTIQQMLPILNNPASVVLTSTAMIEKGVAGMSVYAASKAAVRSLARTLSVELLDQGVRVNAICPGLIDTPIYGKLGLPAEAVTAWAGELLAKVPAGRFGRADEVAQAVLFLASDESRYMRGASMLYDGGFATL